MCHLSDFQSGEMMTSSYIPTSQERIFELMKSGIREDDVGRGAFPLAGASGGGVSGGAEKEEEEEETDAEHELAPIDPLSINASHRGGGEVSEGRWR